MIFEKSLSTNSLRKGMDISIENLYVDMGLKGINRWQVTPHESPNGRHFSVKTRRKLGGAFLGILAHLNLNKSLYCKCRKMYCQTGGILNLRSGLFGPKLISLLHHMQSMLIFFFSNSGVSIFLYFSILKRFKNRNFTAVFVFFII